MVFLFGTVLGGTVEKVDRNSIKTKFLVIMVPLLPLGSFYVVESPKSFTMNPGQYRVIPVKLHWKSVGLGYLRMYSWVPSVLFWCSPVPRWLGLDWMWTGYVGLGIFLVWTLFTLFGTGRLSRAEKQRRRQLRETTGYAIDAGRFTKTPATVGFPRATETL